MQGELLDDELAAPPSKWPVRAFNILTILGLLYLLLQFLDYLLFRFNILSNPLLPTYTADYFFLGSAIKGIVLTIALLAGFICKLFRWTIIAVTILAMGIMVAYFSIFLFPV